MKRIKELKNKRNSELQNQLAELEKELIKLNAQVAIGTTLKNPGELKRTKKTIARLKTLIKQNG